MYQISVRQAGNLAEAAKLFFEKAEPMAQKWESSLEKTEENGNIVAAASENAKLSVYNELREEHEAFLNGRRR